MAIAKQSITLVLRSSTIEIESVDYAGLKLDITSKPTEENNYSVGSNGTLLLTEYEILELIEVLRRFER